VTLVQFAKKHRNEIRSDPAFRAKFLEMCGPLGVDPLASTKGFWGSLLGIGSFYHELAVKVAEACLASRGRNGGIVSVKEVVGILERRGTKFDLSSTKTTCSEKDVVVAIGKLAVLGSGFGTFKVGNTIMILSVPCELDNDHTEVMDLAQIAGGSVCLEEVAKKLSWNQDRAKRSLDLLLSKGMAWLDLHQGKQYYWVPSVWKECSQDN